MLAPLSQIKDYVKITLPEKELAEKLTEAGLGVESIEKKDNDSIFDLEVTPNRPDWLSIVGVAREIAALQNSKIILPKASEIKKPNKILPLKIKTDYSVNPRFTGIAITGIKVGESPQWLKKRLEQIGQRSINNIVDITNFVMHELGNPLHAFDYDKIEGAEMTVTTAAGGESFESVDGIIYRLPKGAVIIKDSKKIIDLCGVKGGKNSGTYEDTKTVFIRVPVEVPSLIRKTSAQLGLRSDASSIFEKGVDRANTIFTLKRCVDLILQTAGGEIASDIYDLKEKEFTTWKVKVKIEKIEKHLGFKIPDGEIIKILERLNLNPKIKENFLETEVPTYRNDLKIDEDIIEEIARLYGYNKIEKKLPTGEIPTKKIPYFKDYSLPQKAKEILIACGFSEIKSYSLVSETELNKLGLSEKNILRVDNPVSRDFEYLRPSLKIGLTKGLLENTKFIKEINLFELGKTYNKQEKKAEEEYMLSGISNNLSYAQIKGVLEKLFKEFGIKKDPSSFIEIMEDGIFFEINFSEIEKKANTQKTYKPIPKYPPIIEDISLRIPEGINTGDIVEHIKNQSDMIYNISLIDEFEENKTFHVIYINKQGNLTKEDVGKLREKILKSLQEKFKISEN